MPKTSRSRFYADSHPRPHRHRSLLFHDRVDQNAAGPRLIILEHRVTRHHAPRTISACSTVLVCGGSRMRKERRRLGDIPGAAPHSGLAPAGSDHQARLNPTRAAVNEVSAAKCQPRTHRPQPAIGALNASMHRAGNIPVSLTFGPGYPTLYKALFLLILIYRTSHPDGAVLGQLPGTEAYREAAAPHARQQGRLQCGNIVAQRFGRQKPDYPTGSRSGRLSTKG